MVLCAHEILGLRHTVPGRDLDLSDKCLRTGAM